MKKKLLNYTDRIDRLLKSDSQDTDWNTILEDHLAQTGFFQHERLVHLIVTVSFGFFLALIANPLLFAIDHFHTFLGVFILFLLIAVTLVFYIFHYFFLENSVQKLYDQYDEILRKKLNC